MTSSSSNGRPLKRADPSTIQDKFMVGYQGWFTCAGDGPPLEPGHHGWLHWFNHPVPDGGRPNTDLWPDVSEYSPSELYPAPGVKYPNGDQAFLFSSRHPLTVQRHFHWMAMHGVDGAFLQRFAGQTDLDAGNQGIRDQRDEVGDRVREAAEKEGRVFAIMYDVSGVAPDRIQRVIEQDWRHLIHDKRVLDSPSYLRENGKAVVTLWGFGMVDSKHDPAVVRAITKYIRNNTPGGAYIMGGTPAYWRTSESDADRNPEFVSVWLEEFDAISPWTIGRYRNEEEADRFERHNLKDDMELIKKRNALWEQNKRTMRKIDYIPVVLPGGSGFNLSEGNWGWNDIARRGGHFLWRQIFNVRKLGVRTIYGAMWDEYDEGTALMPVVTKKRLLPTCKDYNFMALDEDGFDLPSDWYMRICGFAGEGLRGERAIDETFPTKELQDYWSTRPRYEDKGNVPGPGKWQSYSEWERTGQVVEENEPPPPPYELQQPPPANSSTRPPGPPLVPDRTSFSSTGPPIPSAARPPLDAQYAPPPVVPSSRPQVPVNSDSLQRSASQATQAGRSQTPQDVAVLADDFARQSITSSSSPRFDTPSLHPQRPYQPPYASPHDTSFPPVPLPSPGFPPTLMPPPSHSSTHSPGPSPGPWSQAAWPPTEWGTGPPPPQPHAQQSYSSYPGQSYRTEHSGPQNGPGYTPSYMPGYEAPPPPPLRPRPSMPSDSSYGESNYAFPRPNQAPSPYHSPPTSPTSYAPPEPAYQIPQAPPPMSQPSYYGEPQPPPQGYSWGAPPPPPHSGPGPDAYGRYYQPPPGPPPGMGGYYNGPGQPPPPPPPRPAWGPPPGPGGAYGPPPTHPAGASGYPSNAAPAASLSSDPLGFAKNTAQGLAQAGSKFFHR